MVQYDIMRRIILFLGFGIILSLLACEKAEDFLTIQKGKHQAKVTAGIEAYEAQRFGDAIEAFNEAAQYGVLDQSASEFLEKAKAGEFKALVSAGHQAMSTEDYDAAYKAFSNARAFSHNDDLLIWMDDAVTKAWRKSGAEVCWMRVKGQGLTFTLEQQPEGFVPNEDESHKYIRSFKIRTWTPGMLSSLPPPRKSFGLDLSFTSLGDDAIDDLARFENIYILDLRFSNLTAEGRKKVRAMLSAQWMSL